MNDTKTRRLIINGIQEVMDMQRAVNIAPASEAERVFKTMAENIKLVLEVNEVTGRIRVIQIDVEGGNRG